MSKAFRKPHTMLSGIVSFMCIQKIFNNTNIKTIQEASMWILLKRAQLRIPLSPCKLPRFDLKKKVTTTTNYKWGSYRLNMDGVQLV